LQETIDGLQEQMSVQVAAAIADASAEASSSTSDDAGWYATIKDQFNFETSLRNQDVMPWVEAGLDALYRQEDVRATIANAMVQDDIDISKVILDADPSDFVKPEKKQVFIESATSLGHTCSP
jgi:hypothetical protein